MTWRHDSVLNHIMGWLKSAFVGQSTVELYCDLEGLQAPCGGSIPTDVLTQAQRLDPVILDRSIHGQHRIAFVELTSPRDKDAKKAKEGKASRYAYFKIALGNER
jgi:hypothetical protein